MYYIREHPVDRYIERIENVTRESARTKIMEAMLFPNKHTEKKNHIAYLKDNLVVIASKQYEDIFAVTSINFNTARKNNWWYKELRGE